MPASDRDERITFDDSVEALLAHHSTRTRWVYFSTLTLVLAASAALATASVDVTVRAQATLRSVADRQALRAMSGGVVAGVRIQRDQHVHAGDTLLVMGASSALRSRDALRLAWRDQRDAAVDLEQLLAATRGDDSVRAGPYRLPRLAAAAAAANVEWRQESIRMRQATRARDRISQLEVRGFAARSELDDAQLELDHAVERRSLSGERRRAEWTTALAVARQRAVEIGRDLAREEELASERVVIAPVSGSVEELGAFSRGSTLRAGDAVAVISPDSALEADVLVSPRDIGHIRPGMSVRLLVEGYDVQEWGAASGVVTTVAADYTLERDVPVFHVRVRPSDGSLRRADGRTAVLRKGVRCQARFLVGRRRIKDLVLHRAREWADPTSVTD